MKQRLLTISVNTRYRVIFGCLYWKSQGISCGLESGHPDFNNCCCCWFSCYGDDDAGKPRTIWSSFCGDSSHLSSPAALRHKYVCSVVHYWTASFWTISRTLFQTSSSDTDCILTFSLGLSVPTLRRFCRLRTMIRYDVIWCDIIFLLF